VRGRGESVKGGIRGGDVSHNGRVSPPAVDRVRSMRWRLRRVLAAYDDSTRYFPKSTAGSQRICAEGSRRIKRHQHQCRQLRSPPPDSVCVIQRLRNYAATKVTRFAACDISHARDAAGAIRHIFCPPLTAGQRRRSVRRQPRRVAAPCARRNADAEFPSLSRPRHALPRR
jgi:hypothetical protein